MINDKLVSNKTKLPGENVDLRSPASNDYGEELDDAEKFEDDCDEDDGNELPLNTEELDQQELYLEELTEIDELCGRIETDIAALAAREQKEVSEVEAMIEAAAEQNDETENTMGTGGLDKIVERDDEGGGEQAESGTDCEDGESNGLTI